MPTSKHSSATDIGLHRKNNEDALLSNSILGLWLIADGMGGHEAGEVASEIAVSTIRSSVLAGHSITSAIQRAHATILAASARGIGKPGMGSTVVALKNKGDRYQIAWVGDSRAYLWRKEADGPVLSQLTTDHSYVQLLYQSGLIQANEMTTHPERNIITQCLGSLELDKVVVDSLEREWQPNERVLLCSDGLTDAVSDNLICQIIDKHTDVESAVNELVLAALDNGGRDNISLILLEKPESWLNNLLNVAYRVINTLIPGRQET